MCHLWPNLMFLFQTTASGIQWLVSEATANSVARLDLRPVAPSSWEEGRRKRRRRRKRRCQRSRSARLPQRWVRDFLFRLYSCLAIFCSKDLILLRNNKQHNRTLIYSFSQLHLELQRLHWVQAYAWGGMLSLLQRLQDDHHGYGASICQSGGRSASSRGGDHRGSRPR